MSSISLKNASGKAAGDINIEESWLERQRGKQAVHDTVVAHLAAQRGGNAKSKTRSEVRGGGAKPWAQKGFGRARAGSTRSPIWVGGGVTFGPSPRSYRKKINDKVKRLALKRAFTERLDADDIIGLDKLEMAAPKTKELASLLKAIEAGDNALIIVDKTDKNLAYSSRNLPKVQVVSADQVNVYQILLHKKIVITQAGLEALGKRLA